MYEIMTPHKAALRIWSHMKNDPHPKLIARYWMEGRHIPEGTFNEFVHELKGMGACIHKFAPDKSVVVSGY